MGVAPSLHGRQAIVVGTEDQDDQNPRRLGLGLEARSLGGPREHLCVVLLVLLGGSVQKMMQWGFAA